MFVIQSFKAPKLFSQRLPRKADGVSFAQASLNDLKGLEVQFGEERWPVLSKKTSFATVEQTQVFAAASKFPPGKGSICAFASPF